jgi:hypothetical protein
MADERDRRSLLPTSPALALGNDAFHSAKTMHQPAQYLVAMAAFLSTSAVMAENPEHPWYLGATLGKAQVEDFSSNSMRYDLILGWQPLSYLAIEASYINLGKYVDASASDPILRIDGFGGALLGFLPINERVKATGRFGLHRLDIEHGFEGYETKLARILGVGAEWVLQDRFAMRFEFQHIADITDRHANGKYDANSLIAGVLYRF